MCQMISALVAEGTRFELVVGLLLRQFSKLVVSATHPPFQVSLCSAWIRQRCGDYFHCACKVNTFLFNLQ